MPKVGIWAKCITLAGLGDFWTPEDHGIELFGSICIIFAPKCSENTPLQAPKAVEKRHFIPRGPIGAEQPFALPLFSSPGASKSASVSRLKTSSRFGYQETSKPTLRSPNWVNLQGTGLVFEPFAKPTSFWRSLQRSSRQGPPFHALCANIDSHSTSPWK